MDKTPTKPSAVERAERILNRWQPGAPTPESAPRRPPRGPLRAAAYGYVSLAATLQSLVDPIRRAWQQSVDDARREREEQVARTAGAPAARREGSEERRGEQTLDETADDAAQAAGAAGDAAGA